MNMKTAVIALSLVLLLLVGCAPKPKVQPPAMPAPVQPITQPAAEQSATADVDSFESELNELDQLDADLSELESI